VIELDTVDVELGGVSILEGVSLDVPEGEFLALVGPNGAGKTTLLRTCNGLVSPTSGAVRIAGNDISSQSARSVGRLVATVPQETMLAFDFDVESIVEMGRTPHRPRFKSADASDRNAVRSALERTDTARFAERSVESLSGGERQRVVFARALAQETPVLLLDEPTASLDINHQIRTLNLARELTNDGKTVIAAIHDLDLAARFCDRVALLSEGKLVAEGTPSSVFTSERLEAAFGIRTAVSTNPVTGRPIVTPLSDGPPRDRRVHVLGGGETAAQLLGRLAEAGFELTAGVLPEGDVATRTAGEVARTVVTAQPFEPVPDDRIAAVTELVNTADVVVVAGILDATNERIARRVERLIATDAVRDPPSGARVVSTRELVEELENPATFESTTQL